MELEYCIWGSKCGNQNMNKRRGPCWLRSVGVYISVVDDLDKNV